MDVRGRIRLELLQHFLPLLRALRVVDRTVEQPHDVRFLLDRPALLQVRHRRSAVLALLRSPVELRQDDDRHVELLRRFPDPLHDLRQLQVAVVPGPLRAPLHDLHVVDDDELGLVQHHRTPGTRPELRDRQPRGVVQNDPVPDHRRRRRGQLWELIVGQVTVPEPADVDPSAPAQNPVHDLLPRHLHREQRHGGAFVVLQRGRCGLDPQRDVLRDVDPGGALAHRRTPRKHVDVFRLQPVEHVVEGFKSGHQPDRFSPLVVAGLNPVHGVEHLLFAHRAKAFRVGRHGADVDRLALELFEEVLRVVLFVVTTGGERRAEADDPPQDPFFPQDPHILAPVRRRRHEELKLGDDSRAARRLQLVFVPQMLGERDELDRLFRGGHVDDGLKHQGVRRGVEVLDLDRRADFLDDLRPADEHTPQQGFLGVRTGWEQTLAHAVMRKNVGRGSRMAAASRSNTPSPDTRVCSPLAKTRNTRPSGAGADAWIRVMRSAMASATSGLSFREARLSWAEIRSMIFCIGCL